MKKNKVIYLFGSNDCEKCSKIRYDLFVNSINYYYVDILKKENDDICEYNNVNEVPHLRIFYMPESEDSLIYDAVGDNISILKIKEILKN